MSSSRTRRAGSRGIVLLYSPDLDGHRQVYCERWARVLLANGFEICIAGSFRTLDEDGLLPDLAQVIGDPRASCVDLSVFPGRGQDIEVQQLAGLVRRLGATVTVLLEADDHLSALAGQMGRAGVRLPGRRVGLFIRSTNYSYGQREKRSIRTRVGWLRRLPADWRQWPRLFHEWLLPNYGLLDVALCLDEYFVGSHERSHRWLPDIYQSSGWARSSTADAKSGKGAREDVFIAQLRRFVAAHAGQELLVYFGTAYARRGYDTLMRLAAGRHACFIHCGLRNDGDPYVYDVVGLRSTLRERGDLLETDAYVPDFSAASALFAATRSVVLPYRHHLGSSGVMLQALRAGRPVLVPDQGLMARRVRDHGLGAAYRPCDWSDLERQHVALLNGPADDYAAHAARFLAQFSDSNVEQAILAAVAGTDAPCELPRPARALRAKADGFPPGTQDVRP